MGKPIVIMFHNRRILKNVGPSEKYAHHWGSSSHLLQKCVCVCHHRHQPDQGKKIPAIGLPPHFDGYLHGSLNVPIEHHPTIRYMVYNGYYKVMSNIPKMGQLPTPV